MRTPSVVNDHITITDLREVFVNLIVFFFPPQLQKKQKEQLNIGNKINQNKDVINALTEHLKNLKQEVSHTQVTFRDYCGGT